MKRRQLMRTLAASLFLLASTSAQGYVPNYDESRVPKYTLPKLLVCSDGTAVKDAETWRKKRRPEVLALFATHVYGKTPAKSLGKPKYEVATSEKVVLGGKRQKDIVRRLVTIRFPETPKAPVLHVLMYLPKSERRCAAFVGNNFQGNHTVTDDPAIEIPEGAKQYPRGARAGRWAIPTITARGYAVATIWYGELMPDRVIPAFDGGRFRTGRARAPDEWGAIGTWAWGLSRVMDYLQTDAGIDGKRIAVMGHSRNGKAALWAAAQDERFAMAISNESGGFGAALTRRHFGGTDIAYMTRGDGSWFCENLRKYAGRETVIPAEQHMLIASIAPRPVYVASAKQDLWCDPRGEFLGAMHADPVYRLLGLRGMDERKQPAVETPIGDFIGYHIRKGKHNVTLYDWERYLDFADRHFRNSDRKEDAR